ncbi:costars domain-containing protein, partial [Tribonema minus]
NNEQIEREVEHLRKVITRLGTPQADGKIGVTYGVLFDDEEGQDYFEALMGTLKAAKKRGVVDFQGQMLLKGAHDSVMVTLLKPLT